MAKPTKAGKSKARDKFAGFTGSELDTIGQPTQVGELSLGERAGRRLAIQMLEDLTGNCIHNRAGIQAKYRHGKAQLRTTQAYFDFLRERDNRDLDAGFHAVLSDLLSACMEGSTPDSSYYERFIDGDVEAEGASHG